MRDYTIAYIERHQDSSSQPVPMHIGKQEDCEDDV